MDLKDKVFFRSDEQVILTFLIGIFLLCSGIEISKRVGLSEVKIDKRIDINTADIFTLEALPYVGPKRAAKIMESRQKHGSFSSLEDVNQRIKGIGIKRLQEWKELVVLTDDKLPEEEKEERNEKKVIKKKIVIKKEERININTATREELETLPRIGPKLAKAIIDYQREQGNFKSIEEITKVKGIGQKTFEKLSDLITVGESTDYTDYSD